MNCRSFSPLIRPSRQCVPHTAAQRCGSTLLDVTVACAIMGVLFAILIPLLGRTTRLSLTTSHRDEAQLLVSNLLERSSRLVAPTVEQLQPLAEELTRETNLHSPQWILHATPEPESGLHRVEATLSWESRPEQRQSVMLVRWLPGRLP